MTVNKRIENAVGLLKTVDLDFIDKPLTTDNFITIAQELLNKGVIFPEITPNNNPRLESASVVQKNIVALIKAKNLSFGELARRTGIPQSSVQRYFSGYTPKIPIDVVEKIAAAFDVSPAELCGWN